MLINNLMKHKFYIRVKSKVVTHKFTNFSTVYPDYRRSEQIQTQEFLKIYHAHLVPQIHSFSLGNTEKKQPAD